MEDAAFVRRCPVLLYILPCALYYFDKEQESICKGTNENAKQSKPQLL